MIIKNLKARILRVLKALPRAADDGDCETATPPSPAKPGAVASGCVVHSDGFSDDAFFDAHDTPKNHHTEPIDAWELVEQAGAVAGAPDPLQEFPAKCPPGGEEAVVLYTTTLRGVRKTFEDCNMVRSLLENLAVAFQERDISMDKGLRDELWAVLGEKAVPPRLFVRGRDIGGAAEVVALHEDDRLIPLLLRQHPPQAPVGKCEACGGLRFVVCGECAGSRKVFDGDRGFRCRRCNENGLAMCPLCL